MTKRSGMKRKPGKRKPAAAKSAARKATPDTDLRKKNAGLRRKLAEALDYQAAIGDVLNVISRSPNNLQPVMDTIVDTARRLCRAEYALMLKCDSDGTFRIAAHSNASQKLMDWMQDNPVTAGDGSAVGIVAAEKQTVHLHDSLSDPRFTDLRRQRQSKARTMLGVPLLNDQKVIGVVFLARTVVKPFEDNQVDLVTSFADQAVIAIANVRLFDEVQARTEDLREALQFQTATSDVLKVISRSPDALQPVLDAIVETSRALCSSDASTIFLLRDRQFHVTAVSGIAPTHLEFLQNNPASLDQHDSVLPRAAREKRTLHYPNVFDDPELKQGYSGVGGPRALLVVPLMKDSEVIGAIVLRQSHLKPFTQRQIELVETFADQAVIAISNVNLFEQVQQRTRDLTEALQQQTATSNVLKVISRSAFDLDSVMSTLAHSAGELCGTESCALFLREGDLLVCRGVSAVDFALADVMRQNPVQIDTESHMGRAVLTGTVANIADFQRSNTNLRKFHALMGFNSFLAVPLMREGRSVGVFTLNRKQFGAFTERQVELVQGFADQAVIAIENVRLFDEVQARTRELVASLEDLRSAQDRLVQTEKLASLGQLTAGIAHEIKNPLNFVNNFSALSAELVGEMKDALSDINLDKNKREELDEIARMLKDNLEKIVQHGKRADSIVKNMLQHSREGSGEHRLADINAIVDESLNLAYHGARAEKAGFSMDFQRDLDPSVGMADVFPQEITRVLLNIISNGFYAATKRKAEAGDGFKPMLSATTKNLGDKVEIRIRDNGTGIPEGVKEKIFNPFFTTKPSGEGTGLGLSMSHDIIVKQHRGSIDVETEPGFFTEFKIVLPRASQR